MSETENAANEERRRLSILKRQRSMKCADPLDLLKGISDLFVSY